MKRLFLLFSFYFTLTIVQGQDVRLPDYIKPEDRICFALKTISGFSIREISAALLTKEETIKKRLSRARKSIIKSNLQFNIPQGSELPVRLESVMEVLYLIFNEGFHSISKDRIIREDLCGEAMRLCKLLLKHKLTRQPKVYALFALMCFHSARLASKTNLENEILDLKHQDRSLWHFPLVELGNSMMYKAVETDAFSSYHFEAAIAAEHLRAPSYDETDWEKIRHWYTLLHEIQPMPIHKLTLSVISLQMDDLHSANAYLDQVKPSDFEQRAYLYYATQADILHAEKRTKVALQKLDLALEHVLNDQEKQFLLKKRSSWI